MPHEMSHRMRRKREALKFVRLWILLRLQFRLGRTSSSARSSLVPRRSEDPVAVTQLCENGDAENELIPRREESEVRVPSCRTRAKPGAPCCFVVLCTLMFLTRSTSRRNRNKMHPCRQLSGKNHRNQRLDRNLCTCSVPSNDSEYADSAEYIFSVRWHCAKKSLALMKHTVQKELESIRSLQLRRNESRTEVSFEKGAIVFSLHSPSNETNVVSLTQVRDCVSRLNLKCRKQNFMPPLSPQSNHLSHSFVSSC